jgi:hypothetical protein
MVVPMASMMRWVGWLELTQTVPADARWCRRWPTARLGVTPAFA